MWSRVLRLLAAVFNIYSFYANPVKYIFSLLAVILIPYLVYIFWGGILIIALMILGIYGLFKLFSGKKSRSIY